jgi:lipopolysaccharide/colanic/teichoic acid biosynthesis glycosyltransferase
MLMNEFVERLSHGSLGGGERRSSGPTVLESTASGALVAREPQTTPILEERNRLMAAAIQGEHKPLPPWRAVGQVKGRPGYFLAKRCLDFSLALLALLLLSPLLLVVALLVRLTSRGPIFFRQQRVGYNGRRFTMFKFRSMYVDSDESLHRAAYEQFFRGERADGKVGEAVSQKPMNRAPGQKGAASTAPRHKHFRYWTDPRVTFLGYLLRRTSIDELPQLFNVLRGEMSIVGPRPPIPYEVEFYNSWHLGRLDTLPGITGFWQIYGRGRVSFERMVQMDLEYIEKQTFWYDLKLLCLTIPAVLSRKGAS